VVHTDNGAPDRRDAWLVLNRMALRHGRVVHALLARAGGPLALLADFPAACPARLLMSLRAPEWDGARADRAWANAVGQTILSPDSPTYPPLLRELADPPLALFVSGDAELLATPQIAIVGSRNPTSGGAATARDFARALSRTGLAITSGLAVGIDGEAHRGALEAGGTTLAVTAAGPDRIYPAVHRRLAGQIAERGVLVTEHPPGSPPRRGHFPRRNRLISGLALGVLVIEAGPRSGSLITARLAGEQGREVFAVPGSIHNPLARGCHRLIRQGAKLVETVDDVLVELAPRLRAALAAAPADGRLASGARDPAPSLDAEYRAFLESIGYDPTPIDVLIERTGLTAEVVSSMLLSLELQGCVGAFPGGRYARIRG